MNDSVVATPGGTPSAPLSPGRALAALRVKRGISIDEVARNLKFAPRQIEALEAEDFAALPGVTIIRGMVRGYAKMLGTDPEPLLADLRQRLTPTSSPESIGTMAVPFPTRSRASHRLQWMIAGVVVAIGLLVATEWFIGERDARPSSARTPTAAESSEGARADAAGRQAAIVEAPSTSSATPALPAEPLPATPSSPAPVAAAAEPQVEQRPPVPPGMKRIVLRFERDSWVEIKSGTGQTLLHQINPAGTEKTIEGPAPFNLVIGAATGVKVSYNDQPIDLAPHTRIDVARLTLN